MFPNNLTRVAGRALVFTCLFLPVAGTAFSQDRRADEVVQRAMDEGRELPVIVRFNNDAALERGQQKLPDARGARRTRHRTLRAIGARASAQVIRELLEDHDTAWVSYDAPVAGMQTMSAPAVPVSIDASGAASARTRYRVDGSGVRVAVIDSGIQPHSDLPVSRVAAFVDFVNGRTTPYDDYGHGTHVAGIIAGSGAASNGAYTGAAPGADIVALKVLDSTGTGSTSNVIAALDWVLTNAATYNIRIVNISLGHPVFEAAATDPLVAMVEALSRAGIVVVASAGNLGADRETRQPLYGTVTSPGNAPSAITVGAAHTHGSLARSDDTVTDYSSKGPTRFELQAKPDIVAPGHAIVSLAVAGSYLQSTYPHLEVAPGYFRLNGTSMAAPVVAGAAALMLDGNPGLSAHTVKAVLQFTAQQMSNVDAMTQGAGELNVAGAVRLAQLIEPTRKLNRYWLRLPSTPNPFDVLFAERVEWSKRAFWGDRAIVGDSAYVHLRAWDDEVAWSQQIVWATAPNIVWATGPNIVWATGPNIVWATGANIVWATIANIVWATGQNIVWATGPNIVWATGPNIVWATGPNIVWATEALVYGADDELNASGPTTSTFAKDVGLGDQVVSPSQIVWATTASQNIVWATGSNIVWATGPNIVWATSVESVLVRETE
jgi:serine protease AprX